jgi:hypothetical protein
MVLRLANQERSVDHSTTGYLSEPVTGFRDGKGRQVARPSLCPSGHEGRGLSLLLLQEQVESDKSIRMEIS